LPGTRCPQARARELDVGYRLGGSGAAGPIDERTPLEPHAELRGAYTSAKLGAEQLVSEHCRAGAVQAVILRPGQIHGGRIPVLTPAVARRLGKRWLVLGDGSVRLPLVHLDDVVDGIMAAMESDLPNGEVIQLVAEETPTQDEVLRRELGPKVRVIHLPRLLVFALGKLTEPAFALLRRPSPFSLYRLRSALARRTFESKSARKSLNWHPRSWNSVERADARPIGAAMDFKPLGSPVPVQAESI